MFNLRLDQTARKDWAGWSAFMFKIEVMTIPRGTGGIVENGLMRNLDRKDLTHDLSCFSGRYSKRNIESQNQPEDILTVMNLCQFHGWPIPIILDRTPSSAADELILER